MPAFVGLFFQWFECSSARVGRTGARRSLSLRTWAEIRSARFVVGCAVVCVLAMLASAPAAAAPQTSTGDASATKPAIPSTTASTHPKTTAKSSGASAGAKPSTAAKSTSPKTASSANATARTHTASTGKRSSRKKSTRARGQQKIDSERARSIQEALIREHYLSGEATGTWNQASEEAMRRYQADHGWQSKTVPDSRALIKLGLGPSKDHLLNPESAMTTVPDAPRAQPLPTTSHSAAPGVDPVPTKNPNQGDPSTSPQ
jgi:hypothetical protein